MNDTPDTPVVEPTPAVPTEATPPAPAAEPAAPATEPTLNEPAAVLEGKEESVTGKDPWVGNHKVAE